MTQSNLLCPSSSPTTRRKGCISARIWAAGMVVVALASGGPGEVQARPAGSASTLSAMSVLPSAVVVVGVGAAGVSALAAGASFTLAAVQVSAQGTEWVLQRASDGARVVLRFTAGAAAEVGQAVEVTAIAGGRLLSCAGRVVAFVPDASGHALWHHERVSP